MKRNLYYSLLALIFCVITTNSQAHAIWIEANPNAKINQSQYIKIFYGEYAAAEIENVDRWYSDLKNIEVWLISPTQQKTKLALTDRKSFLESTFTPKEEGTYLITTIHLAKDLGGKSKYEFSSALAISVGKESKIDVSSLALSVTAEAKTYSLQDNITLSVFNDGKAASNTEVIVMSDSGWSKTYKSDENGQVVFKPLWSGNYVIEASSYLEQAGMWNGLEHTHVWQGSTTFIKVN